MKEAVKRLHPHLVGDLYGAPRAWHDGKGDDADLAVVENTYRVNGILLRCPDGAFDEIAAQKAFVHVEVMTDDHLWLVVNDVHLNVGIADGKLVYALWARPHTPVRDFFNLWRWRLTRALYFGRGRRRAHRPHTHSKVAAQ